MKVHNQLKAAVSRDTETGSILVNIILFVTGFAILWILLIEQTLSIKDPLMFSLVFAMGLFGIVYPFKNYLKRWFDVMPKQYKEAGKILRGTVGLLFMSFLFAVIPQPTSIVAFLFSVSFVLIYTIVTVWYSLLRKNWKGKNLSNIPLSTLFFIWGTRSMIITTKLVGILPILMILYLIIWMLPKFNFSLSEKIYIWQTNHTISSWMFGIPIVGYFVGMFLYRHGYSNSLFFTMGIVSLLISFSIAQAQSRSLWTDSKKPINNR